MVEFKRNVHVTIVKEQVKLIKDKCATCHGKGTVNNRKKIKVTIPAGVDDGQQLRVSGQGEPGVNGGPSGDLYIVFRVKVRSSL